MSGKKNKNLSEYWHGYRSAKIYALIYAIENRKSIFDTTTNPNTSDQFMSGLEDGFQALAEETLKLIEKDRKGGRKNV